MIRTIPIFLLVSILFLQGSCVSQEKDQEISSPEYAPSEIIVKFKPEALNEEGELISESIKDLNVQYGLISMEPLFKGPRSAILAYICLLQFPEEVDIIELIQEYTKDPSVIYAEPNYIMHAIEKDSDAEK